MKTAMPMETRRIGYADRVFSYIAASNVEVAHIRLLMLITV